jgi:hypothetical protein
MDQVPSRDGGTRGVKPAAAKLQDMAQESAATQRPSSLDRSTCGKKLSSMKQP